MDEYIANKRVEISFVKASMGYSSIVGKVIDESDLYYVIELSDRQILAFKANIRYIEIIGDESSEENDD